MKVEIIGLPFWLCDFSYFPNFPELLCSYYVYINFIWYINGSEALVADLLDSKLVFYALEQGDFSSIHLGA